MKSLNVFELKKEKEMVSCTVSITLENEVFQRIHSEESKDIVSLETTNKNDIQ